MMMMKNARKVALLEAQSTVGGRCKQTNNIAKWPVELGAEFIHGEVKNPVKDLITETMRREEDLEEDLMGKRNAETNAMQRVRVAGSIRDEYYYY